MGGGGLREKGVGWKSPQPGREAFKPPLSHALCFLSLSDSTDSLADPSSAQNYWDFRDSKWGGGEASSGLGGRGYIRIPSAFSVHITAPWLRNQVSGYLCTSPPPNKQTILGSERNQKCGYRLRKGNQRRTWPTAAGGAARP